MLNPPPRPPSNRSFQPLTLPRRLGASLPTVKREPRSVLRGHGDGLGSSAPDVYSVAFHSGEGHVITASHDRTVRLYDVERSHVS